MTGSPAERAVSVDIVEEIQRAGGQNLGGFTIEKDLVVEDERQRLLAALGSPSRSELQGRMATGQWLQLPILRGRRDGVRTWTARYHRDAFKPRP